MISRSKRILDLAQQQVTDTGVQTRNAKRRQREESPIPEEFQEDLIQLQDLLGDIFSDSSNNLTEDMPYAVDLETYRETSTSATPVISAMTTIFETPNLEKNEENISIQAVSSTISSSIVSNTTQSVPVEIDTHNNRSEELYSTPMPSPPISPHDQNCNDQFCVVCVDRLIPQDGYENIGTPSDIFSSYSNAPTPSSTASLRTKTFKTDKGKKRLVHKDKWVTVQRKLKKNTGQEFVNKKGKVVKEKQMKDSCTDKCRLKCNQKLSHDDRLQIFKYFWLLGEKQRHWEFVIKHTKKGLKRRQTTEVTKHDRQNTFQYFLPDAEKNKLKVCKTMFLNTISLSERVVTTAWKKYDGNIMVEEDKRGRYEHNKRVYNDEMVKSVVDHVRCFPVVEAHYVRKNSNKLYLEGVDSVSRMFKLYCEWFDASKYSTKARTKRQYREIVHKNFNLALHRPKKDKCDTCHVFENKSVCTDEEKHAFSKHQDRKNRARDLKKADKQEAKVNSEVVAATFDFQKVLVTPYGEVSVIYYKRRLATLNFTIYNMGSNIGTCYMWHEGIAKRGSIEVSSCLLNFIQYHVEKGVKEFRFWSDNCSGQNRNRIVFSLYLFVAKKFGVSVTHRFLEKGHTQNEGDSVHATIERSCRHKSIWVPEEWYCLSRWAKSEGDPYIIKEIKQEDIFDFKALLANKNWTKNTANQKVMWSSVREVKVHAEQYDRIQYKYDLDDEPNTIIVIRAGMRNKQRLANEFGLNQAYDGPLPISKDKYKDLTDLCRAEIISTRYHDFYYNLPHTDAANLVNDQDDLD